MSRYRDNSGKFTETNTVVFGASVDSVWANKAFHDQLGVEFPILSDFKKEVAKKYGILDEAGGTARRTTFVIDTEGIVRHIDQAREALDPSAAIGAVCVAEEEDRRLGEGGPIQARVRHFEDGTLGGAFSE